MAYPISSLIIATATLLFAWASPAFAQGSDRDDIYFMMRFNAQQQEMRSAPPRMMIQSAPPARAPRAIAPQPQFRGVFVPTPPQVTTYFMASPPQRLIPEITVRPLRDSNQANLNATVRPSLSPSRRLPAPSRSRDEEGTGATENELPGGARAFCVRTCDGFYFPAGPALSGTDGKRAQQFYCDQTCPGSEVTLYTTAPGGTIEGAVGPRGQSYASLATAFQFREKLSPSCTCSGLATRGLTAMPLSHDFTLKAGDVVVTEEGVRVFAGASRFPYRPRDFVDARSYGRLPADVQRRVAEIQAGLQARDRGFAAPVNRVGAGTLSRRAGMAQATSLPLTAGTVTAEGVRVIDLTRRSGTQLR
ncbi:MAG: DUF2865 domain-containing protein [Alphaproteobacteria bacterium]